MKPITLQGLVDLGPANPSAIGRLANAASQLIDSGAPIPPSPFCEWAADRVTGKDRQDLVMFLQGRRGSGKSYSCLYLGKRLAEAIARRKGGTWKDYFSLKNIAVLEDTDSIMRLLNETGEHQIVLVDDCSLAISNRSWNSPQNKNFNALLSVCRTNRWILLLTAPLKKHTDNQTREMCDINGAVYKSFHARGFNILKMTSSDISTSGKEYNRRLNFDGRKIDFWVTFKPDAELVEAYDKQRNESARQVNARIVEGGSFKAQPKTIVQAQSLAERNVNKVISEKGEEIKKYLNSNPDAPTNAIAARFGLSWQKANSVITKLKEEVKT